MALFHFVFNTLLPRLNNPSHRFWLPAALAGMTSEGKPLLPLTSDEWSIGKMQGPDGLQLTTILYEQWWLALPQTKKIRLSDPGWGMYQPAACPDDPFPTLILRNLTINGLDNVLVLPDPAVTATATGYEGILSLQLGTYSQKAQLSIDASYRVQQCVCPADINVPVPTSCLTWSGTDTAGQPFQLSSEEIDGGGTVEAKLTNVFVDASITLGVSGSGGSRALTLQITKASLRGPGTRNPTLTCDKLTIDSSVSDRLERIWIEAAKRALAAPDAVIAVVRNMNAELNRPGTLASLSNTLQQQLADILDQAFGPVPAGALPADGGSPGLNAVDQYLFDRVRYAVNNSSSALFLPAQVLAFSNPRLEPYAVGNIDVGDQFPIQAIVLQNLVATGASNMAAPPATATMLPAGFSAGLALGSLKPPPPGVPAPPLTISGPFRFRIGSTPLTGTNVTISVTGAVVAINVTTAGTSLDDLQLTFNSMTLHAPPSTLSISVTLASAFQTLINDFVNQDASKNKITAAIGSRLADPGALQQISTTATTNTREVLSSKLDG